LVPFYQFLDFPFKENDLNFKNKSKITPVCILNSNTYPPIFKLIGFTKLNFVGTLKPQKNF